MEPEHSPPVTTPRRGAKYEAFKILLGEEPAEWIRRQRPLSYTSIAEDLNQLARDAGADLRVSFESIRHWEHADRPPSGAARAASANTAPDNPPGTVPPAVFQHPGVDDW